MYKNLNTLKAAAKKLAVTTDFLNDMIAAGLIATLQIGKRQFVSNNEIARVLASVAA